MDEFEKLKRLLNHWMEHNNEHAETYREWAEKASSLGNEELSKTLHRLNQDTKRLNKLFEEAIQQIS
ncbi:MAG: hypothetical protein OHK0032_18220 [Thermodesulfovibrionales bacterium]